MKSAIKSMFVIVWLLTLMAGSAFAQSSLPLVAGKVLVDRIDVSSSKKIRLPEGRWVVMGLHTRETPLTGTSRTSQTVQHVSLMNEDEIAPVQYLSISWTMNADVNWTGQPCESRDSIKNRPFKDTFGTNTSSLVVKCVASSFNSNFGDLNSVHILNSAVPIRKSLWLPVAQHSRIKPSSAVELYGYISKHRNDFVEWYAYVDPKFYGLDQTGDTQYTSPVGNRQTTAHNLLRYALAWNKQYLQLIDQDFFPALFQSASRPVEKFIFSERVNPITLAANSSTPSTSNTLSSAILAPVSGAERESIKSEVESERLKRQELEQQLASTKERDRLAAELAESRKKQQELEERLAASQSQSSVSNISPSPSNVTVRSAHALVIGNAAYPGSGRLDNTINDANAMGQKLRSMGFTVTTVTDANRQRLVQAMSQFKRTAANADLSLLFYAGHGVQIFGTNYILPIDVDQNDVAQATIQGVSLNSVVENFLPGKTKLVFLDACRDNPLQRTGDRSVSKGLAPISAAQGTLISYATKDGQTASDGVGAKNSPFTLALLQHIGDPADIAVVLRKVRERVMQTTGGKQQPWEYGSLTGGELILSRIKGGR
jgi:hypothetical protein